MCAVGTAKYITNRRTVQCQGQQGDIDARGDEGILPVQDTNAYEGVDRRRDVRRS